MKYAYKLRNYWKIGCVMMVLLCASIGLQAQQTTADLLLKANKYYELKLFKKAIPAFREVQKADPNQGETYGKLANSYRMINNYAEASSWYLRAVQLPNANPEYFFQYGLVLKSLQQYDQSKLYFKEFAKVDPIRGNHFAASCDFAKQTMKAASFYTVTNQAVNSPHADFGPAFYGNQVVYASSRSDIKNGSNDGKPGWQEGLFNQLFLATPSNGQLSPPTLLRTSFKVRMNEAPVSYTKDGKHVAYTGNNFIDGIRKIPAAGAKLRIYFANVTAPDQWSKPEPFAYNNPEKYNTAYPTLNPDGTLMFFASDMDGGFGGYDIYYSVKNGTTWSSPVNLGPEINSAGDEITPFLAGDVLYFSSDRHYGLGGFDVFRTEKSNGIWNKVQNLGKGVNSSYDDYFFVFKNAKNIGFVTSNRPNGKGSDDIYSVQSAAEKIELAVLAESTAQPIVGAKLDFSSCGEAVAYTNVNGRFKFLALKGLDCKVKVSKDGFEPKTINVSSANRSERLIEVRLAANQPLRGQYVGTIVDAATQKAIPNVLVTAKNMATQRVIETYTDSRGMYAFNLDPATTYLVRYSKASYTTTNKTIDTGDGTDKAVLGALAFEKSAVEAEPTNTEPIESVDKDAPMTRKVPKQAYEIQIGAFSNPDKSKFDALKKFGYVYSIPRGKIKVYKVGAYRTKAQAAMIKKEIAAKGFPDAFVTVNSDPRIIKRVLVGGELDDPIQSDSDTPDSDTPDSRIPPVKPGPKPPKKPIVNKKPSTVPGVVFKVQLGAYRNPQYFDSSKVNDLGTIDLKPTSKGLTLILLGDFSSYQAAKAIVGQVEGRGLPKPIVVAYKNGEKVKLSSVL